MSLGTVVQMLGSFSRPAESKLGSGAQDVRPSAELPGGSWPFEISYSHAANIHMVGDVPGTSLVDAGNREMLKNRRGA